MGTEAKRAKSLPFWIKVKAKAFLVFSSLLFRFIFGTDGSLVRVFFRSILAIAIASFCLCLRRLLCGTTRKIRESIIVNWVLLSQNYFAVLWTIILVTNESVSNWCDVKMNEMSWTLESFFVECAADASFFSIWWDSNPKVLFLTFQTLKLLQKFLLLLCCIRGKRRFNELCVFLFLEHKNTDAMFFRASLEAVRTLLENHEAFRRSKTMITFP